MADKKRTVLLPKTIGTVVLGNLFKNVQVRKRGLGGDIVTFERSNLPSASVEWEASYKRGAGKSLKSKILGEKVFGKGRGKGVFRERTRGERGPRLQFKVKF